MRFSSSNLRESEKGRQRSGSLDDREMMYSMEADQPQLPSISALDLNRLWYERCQVNFSICRDSSAIFRLPLQPLTQVLEAVYACLMMVLCVTVPCSNIVVDVERFRRRRTCGRAGNRVEE